MDDVQFFSINISACVTNWGGRGWG